MACARSGFCPCITASTCTQAWPPTTAVPAPPQVSDREWLATQPGTAERLAKAQGMLAAGQGEEVCFRALDIDGAAMTARRWNALAAVGGDDDYFSSDLTEAELRVRGWVKRGGGGISICTTATLATGSWHWKDMQVRSAGNAHSMAQRSVLMWPDRRTSMLPWPAYQRCCCCRGQTSMCHLEWTTWGWAGGCRQPWGPRRGCR